MSLFAAAPRAQISIVDHYDYPAHGRRYHFFNQLCMVPRVKILLFLTLDVYRVITEPTQWGSWWEDIEHQFHMSQFAAVPSSQTSIVDHKREGEGYGFQNHLLCI